MRFSFKFGGRGNHDYLLYSLIVIIAALFYSNLYFYSNYIAIPLILMWIPSMFTQKTKLDKKGRSFVLVSVVFMSIWLLYKLIRLSDLNMGFMLRQFEWLMAGIISVYAVRLFSARELKILFVSFTIIIVSYLLLLIRISSFISLDSSLDDSEISVTSTWMGSLLMLLSGFCLIFAIHVKNVVPRILSLVLLLLISYLNFEVLQRGTTAIFTVAEMLLILALSVTNRTINRILVPIAIVFVFMVVFKSVLLIQLFDWLSNVVPSERLAKRFMKLTIFLEYGDVEVVGGSFTSRAELMETSWNTFTSDFRHFLFGVGAHRHDNTIIGNHSFILDTLAAYGIIGGLLMVTYFVRQFQIMMSGLDSRNNYVLFFQCSSVFLFYVLRNFYGAVATAQVNFVVLIYFPMIIYLILSNKKRFVI